MFGPAQETELPQYDKIKAEHVVPGIRSLLEQLNRCGVKNYADWRLNEAGHGDQRSRVTITRLRSIAQQGLKTSALLTPAARLMSWRRTCNQRGVGWWSLLRRWWTAWAAYGAPSRTSRRDALMA